MTQRTMPPGPVRERRSPTPAAVHKREAIHRLKAALAADRLELHYQPIADASTGRVESVEALLRWRNPGHAEDLTKLIWAAERSPVIWKLENWILGEASRAAAQWQAEGLEGLRLDVNLSAREFPRANLVGRLKRHLAIAELDPGQLNIEITETSSMSEFGAVAQQLDELIAMGVQLWLDDFGTGHSSLEWLSHLPLHGLKIPGTFVERLFKEPRCQVIVTRVIDLAHDLGLRVIAEEVETEQQRDFLLDRQCDLLQGFLLHAALPAGELPRALQEAKIKPPERSAR
jgi:EAL domain-containing protein (putative c-di-GMP-specific phosphodiesterase class I)